MEALPGIYDQISYHTLANRILEGYGFTFDQQWWPITRAGEPTAHWSYLYTYYLVGIYAVFGSHPLAARLIQAILAGLLMPWLAYRIAFRVFENRRGEIVSSQSTLLAMTTSGERIGLVAAAWIAVYPYFLYYASALMTEMFCILGILWTLDCAVRISRRPIADSRQPTDQSEKQIRGVVWLWLELGLAIGVTILLRQVFLLFVPFLFIWLWWVLGRQLRFKSALSKVVSGGLVSVAVLALMIAPFTLMNYRHFGRFVLLNTNAGYAFFWANHPIQGTRFVSLFTPDMPSYQDLIPSELRNLDEAALDQALLKRGIGFVLDDPWRFILLSISRIPDHFMFWPLSTSSLPSNLTRVLSFGVALPFMILGGILWYSDIRRKAIDSKPGILLISFIFVYSGIHLVSWAGIRYRLPTDAVGLVFAARGFYGIVRPLIVRGFHGLAA